MFDWENAIALHAMQGNGPHLVARGKSHGFSRVAAGTWGIFSSYDGDAHYVPCNPYHLGMRMIPSLQLKR